MEKEIQISYRIKVRAIAAKNKICDGCALNIKGMMCMNVQLCPATDEVPANWEICSKVEKI